MKKFTATIIAVILVLTLAACGGGSKLSGTYTDTATGITSFVFENVKVSTSVMGINTPLGDFEVKGKDLYIGGIKAGKVNGDTLTITMSGLNAEYKKK